MRACKGRFECDKNRGHFAALHEASAISVAHQTLGMLRYTSIELMTKVS
jgi:hypothetical protein